MNSKRGHHTSQLRPHNSSNNIAHGIPPLDLMDINHKFYVSEQIISNMHHEIMINKTILNIVQFEEHDS
jgi:hypothetical protein